MNSLGNANERELLNTQFKIKRVFTDVFGRTPLNVRLEDIEREFYELTRYKDYENLKEETGDLLCSVIQLASEHNWEIRDLISSTLEKIERRREQYKSVGRKTRIAIFGGAFDPIHEGHVKVAELVLKASNFIDEVWLMPCNVSMSGKKMTSGEHRLNMVRHAVYNNPRISAFDYEIKNDLRGASYHIVSTLLNDEYYSDNFQFYFLIGMDNANSFSEWVEFDKLEKIMNFIVVQRKGTVPNGSQWYMQKPHRFIRSDEYLIDISSTTIRKDIDSGLDKVKHLNYDVLK